MSHIISRESHALLCALHRAACNTFSAVWMSHVWYGCATCHVNDLCRVKGESRSTSLCTKGATIRRCRDEACVIWMRHVSHE